MFEVGYLVGPNSLSQASKRADHAHGLAKDDVRISWGLGLVSYRQGKFGEAAEHFAAARGTDAAPNYRAWQSYLLSLALHGQADRAHDELFELVSLLHRKTEDSEPTVEQQAAAVWIGRFAKAEEVTAKSSQKRSEALERELILMKRLGPNLSASLELGNEQVLRQHLRLSEDAEVARETLKKKATAEADAKSQELEKSLSRISDEFEKTRSDSTALKQWYEQELNRLDRNLGRLERDYRQIESLASSVQNDMRNLLRASSAVNFQATQRQNQARSSIQQRQAEAQAAMANDELYGEYIRREGELYGLAQQGARLAAQAEAVLQEKSSVMQKFADATGKLARKDNDLSKWNDRLKRQQDELTKKPESQTLKPRNVIVKANTLRTFVDLDLARERDLIFESYGMSAGKKL